MGLALDPLPDGASQALTQRSQLARTQHEQAGLPLFAITDDAPVRHLVHDHVLLHGAGAVAQRAGQQAGQDAPPHGLGVGAHVGLDEERLQRAVAGLVQIGREPHRRGAMGTAGRGDEHAAVGIVLATGTQHDHFAGGLAQQPPTPHTGLGVGFDGPLLHEHQALRRSPPQQLEQLPGQLGVVEFPELDGTWRRVVAVATRSPSPPWPRCKATARVP